jgi:hypothetical protein
MQTKTCPNSKSAILPSLVELSREISTISGINFLDETIKSTCDFCPVGEKQQLLSFNMEEQILNRKLKLLRKISLFEKIFIFFPIFLLTYSSLDFQRHFYLK